MTSQSVRCIARIRGKKRIKNCPRLAQHFFIRCFGKGQVYIAVCEEHVGNVSMRKLAQEITREEYIIFVVMES